MKSSKKERQHTHTKKDSLLVFFDIIIIEKTHPQNKRSSPLKFSKKKRKRPNQKEKVSSVVVFCLFVCLFVLFVCLFVCCLLPPRKKTHKTRAFLFFFVQTTTTTTNHRGGGVKTTQKEEKTLNRRRRRRKDHRPRLSFSFSLCAFFIYKSS